MQFPREKSKRWDLPPMDHEKSMALANALSISPILASVLTLRGVAEPDKALSFLEASLKDIHDPFLMKGMRESVDRILKAIENNERILIFGDYDVDGITATSLAIIFFREIGIPIDYYLPNRLTQGYGLNDEAIHLIKERETDLVITADCGITANNEIKTANELGMDVIITDHHQAPEKLPDAHAILNPHQQDCPYPFKFLSGVGVIYKLLIALRSELRKAQYPTELPNLKRHLDMVALGTIADIVPLTGENHIFTRHGLDELNVTKKLGLRALKTVSNVMGKKLGSYDVGFLLGPRINAAGRLGDPRRGVELLTSMDMAESMKIASELDQENKDRQQVQDEVIGEAREMIKKEVNLNTECAIVLASENWHPGVLGIAASKIVDYYNRPTILITMDNGVGKGSARSIGVFNIYEGLKECSGLLTEFGGHKAAAGLSLEAEKIPAFKSMFNQVAANSLSPDDLIPTVRADMEINLDELDMDVVKQLESLSPFGLSNPRPSFVARSVKPKGEIMRMGKSQDHIKFKIENSRGVSMDVVGFFMEKFFRKVDFNQSSIDILFSPQVNEWNGRETLQLKLNDCRVSGE